MNSKTHELYIEHAKIEGSSDRSFGVTVGGILLAIGVARWLLFDPSIWSTALLIGVGLVLLLAGILAPRMLAPLNKAWTQLGLLLARVVNPVMLFLMFVLVFVPTAVVLRLRGRDALGLRQGHQRSSYWKERTPPAPDPRTMIQQF